MHQPTTMTNNRGNFSFSRLMELLNGRWHKRASYAFLVIVAAHWAEHLSQAFQVYSLNWKLSEANGVLGMFFPWLISSEWLHYTYAIVMLVGLIMLRPAFQGRSRIWWNIALGLQLWHHFEHFLLLLQALLGTTFFGAPTRTSILQLFYARMELHLFYNIVVFLPMMVAMFYHVLPPIGEKTTPTCSCAWHQKPAV